MRELALAIVFGIGVVLIAIGAFKHGRAYEESQILSVAGKACTDVISKRWPP